MSLALNLRISRISSLLLSLTVLIYSYFCVRSFCATMLAQDGGLSAGIGATRLEPNNAFYWRRLAELDLYRQNDAEAALSAFHRAAQLNPRDAESWIGAAYALQLVNRPTEERDAVARALAAEPRRLETIWQAANLHAVLGDSEDVLAETCVLLTHDRRRAAGATALAQRSFADLTAKPLDCKLPETSR